MKYVKNPNDIPNTPHIGAFVFDTIWIEGDERSKTCPGLGYPGNHATQVTYIVFDDEAEATKWVTSQEDRKYGQPTPYKLVNTTGLTVNKTVSIKLS